MSKPRIRVTPFEHDGMHGWQWHREGLGAAWVVFAEWVSFDAQRARLRALLIEQGICA